MWKFTELADAFDRIVASDHKFLDQEFTQMVTEARQPQTSLWGKTWRYAVVIGGGGTFTVSTEAAKGFVDILRVGDGVQKGGWGYGQDALRLLVFAGPVLRGGRILLSEVAAVDAMPNVGNCGWVATARALRLSGVKHYARLADLIPDGVKPVWGLNHVSDMVPFLNRAGAVVKVFHDPQTLQEVVATTRAYPGEVVMFGIEGEGGGHAILAYANPVSRTVQFLDRTGKVFKDLADLTKGYGSVLVGARPSRGMMVIRNSALTWTLGTVPTLANIIGVEVRSVEITTPDKPSAKK
jgi:hypothetical protein